MSDTEDKMRAEFEAWVNQYWQLDPDRKPDLRGVRNQWKGDWCYTMARTGELFRAWQAALLRASEIIEFNKKEKP